MSVCRALGSNLWEALMVENAQHFRRRNLGFMFCRSREVYGVVERRASGIPFPDGSVWCSSCRALVFPFGRRLSSRSGAFAARSAVLRSCND